MRRSVIAGIIVFALSACFVLIALLPVFSGEVYLPDIFARTPSAVCTREHDRAHFKVIQFWGDDFYTTQLIHTTADGRAIIRGLDADDSKRWTCNIQIDDSSRKLVITFPQDTRYWEYWWDTRRLLRRQETGIIELFPPS